MAYIPANRDLLLSEHVVAQVANNTGYSKKTVSRILDQCSDFIIDALCTGYNVDLKDFGTFYLQKHKGHTTPYAGYVDDYATLKFYPSTDVRDDLQKRMNNDQIIWTKYDVDDPVLEARCVRSTGRPSMHSEGIDLSDEYIIKDLEVFDKRKEMLIKGVSNG